MNEKEYLTDLADKPLGSRIKGYLKLNGPGYMQSAMTLGGGSIASCVLMGSLMGYQLLWVQPLAIFLGFCVLAAVAKQTCQTGEKPYGVFWNRLHPAMALAWGIAALVATVLWHIPQYSLTANGAVELANGVGINLSSNGARAGIGAVVLLAACFVVRLYGQGARGLKIYETLAKLLVWGIVGAFAVVVFSTSINWKELFLGITGISFFKTWMAGDLPKEAIKPIVGGIAAAVGINMVFLYPYSLLKKNWGKEHKELAYFDLMAGMVIPFFFATSFMIIAVANTIGPEPGAIGTLVKDIRTILPVLEGTMPAWAALLLIGLGMFAIGFSTIITHMLASGFIGCELFGYEYKGTPKLLFSLLPAIGVIGVLIPFPWYAAVTASSLAAPLMPVAVIGFIILLNSPSYMGEAMPRGGNRLLWNAVLTSAVVIMCGAAWLGLKDNWADLKKNLAPKEEAAAALFFAPAHAAEEEGEMLKQVVTRNLMATQFEITLYAPADKFSATSLADIGMAALDRIDELERRISDWKVDSFTSKVNRLAAEDPVEVHPDLLELLRISEDAYKETGGVFDVTVGPLLKLWGVYRKEQHFPSQEEIQATLQNVGFDKVKVDFDKRTVQFTQPGVRLDFGGIGKGYALDVVAPMIKAAGIESALLSGGDSSYVAIGAPPGTEGWTIVIDKPYPDGENFIDKVVIKDEAFTTSSGEGRVFEKDGKRFSHIFDPRTGDPVAETLGTMIITPSGAWGEVLSKTLMIYNEDEVRTYCEKHPEVKAIKVDLVEGKPRAKKFNFPD